MSNSWSYFRVEFFSAILKSVALEWVGRKTGSTRKFHEWLIRELSGFPVVEQQEEIHFQEMHLRVLFESSTSFFGCKIQKALEGMAQQDFQLNYTQRTLSQRKRWSKYLCRSQIKCKWNKVNTINCLSAYVILLQNNFSRGSHEWDHCEKSKAVFVIWHASKKLDLTTVSYLPISFSVLLMGLPSRAIRQVMTFKQLEFLEIQNLRFRTWNGSFQPSFPPFFSLTCCILWSCKYLGWAFLHSTSNFHKIV